MSSFDNMTTFGDDGGGDTTVDTPDTGTQPGQQQQPAAETPRDHHASHQERGPDGKFSGPAAPSVKAEPPARLKFRMAREDGSGEEELELTQEEAAQRLAEARKLAKEREKERAQTQQLQREAQAMKRLQEGLKDGKGRAQLFRDFVRQSGMSAEQAEDFFAEVLHAELTEQRLTPEQQRIRELEAEVEGRRRQDQETKAEAEFKQFTETTRTKEAEYSKLWGEALTKTGLPPTSKLLADIGTHYITQKKNGLTLTADELAQYAVGEFDRGLAARLKDLKPEVLGKRFPDLVKAWSGHVDAMEPEAFLKAHPEMGKKLLRHYRALAQAKAKPGVGAVRPPARAQQPAQRRQDEETPQRYDAWNPLG